MEKLTLSIRSKDKIASAKAIARANNTSLSRLFEEYLDALIAFDRLVVEQQNITGIDELWAEVRNRSY